MKNEFKLEGQLIDIEFNGENTRMNIVCGNCTDEYCDTTDVCVYAVGDLTEELSVGMRIRVFGHVVNNKEDICVFLHADKVEPIEPVEIPGETILAIRSLYESSVEDYENVADYIADHGSLDDGTVDPDATYEAGYMNAVGYIMQILGIEVSE